jgi:hypothetical protein
MEYELEIMFHWPHDRFTIGWDVIQPDENYNYTTYNLYLGISTITLNIYQ